MPHIDAICYVLIYFSKLGFNKRLIHEPHIVAKDDLWWFFFFFARVFGFNRRLSHELHIAKISYLL